MSGDGYQDWVVIVFRKYEKRPVFHGFDVDTIGTDYEASRCGRLKDRSMWSYPLVLPIEHATKFGRACRVCFPLNSKES